MSYTKKKIEELSHEIKNHVGYGESKRFYEIRAEMIEKLGAQEWERLLRKTNFLSAVDSCSKTNARIKTKKIK